MQSGGMVRASSESSSRPSSSAGTSQFTPAMRQFSSPKGVRESSDSNGFGEAGNRSSSSRGLGGSASNSAKLKSRYTDDDENDEDDEEGAYIPRGSFSATRNHSVRGNKTMHPEDEEEVDKRVHKSSSTRHWETEGVASPAGRGASSRRYDDDDDEDDEEDETDDGRWQGAVTRRASDAQNRARAKVRQEAAQLQLSSLEMNSASASVSSNSQDKQGGALGVTTPLNLTNLREFLTTPIPRSAGTVLCYIKRNKSGTNRLFPLYTLWLKVKLYLYIATRWTFFFI